MDAALVDAYHRRIGARPGDDVGRLMERHLLTVPFENLSIHLAEPIVLDEPALLDKIVGRRRGGFCYELNGAFAALLRALGFEVDLLSASVFGGADLGPPFDHMALLVHAAEPLLVDVGFGQFSRHPLRWNDRDDQEDPAGRFRLVDTDDGDIDVFMDDVAQYRVERRARRLADFGPTCWWQQTSPDSHFTRSLMCSRSTETGRITLSGERLITTDHGVRSERTLDDDDTIREAYRAHFGIELDRLPKSPTCP